MDKMESRKLSQKEYLRKYLNNKDDGTAKKKKKKIKVGAKTVKIIDDDIDIRNMRPMEDGEFKILNTTEDAPQIVGVIDERGGVPVDFADKRRWRIIADDGEGNVACDSNENYGSPDGVSRAELGARKNPNENGKHSKSKDPSPLRNAPLDRDSSQGKNEAKRSRQHGGSTKKKQKRDSSSDSSSSDSSDSSDRKKSKHKKASSGKRRDSSPTRISKNRSTRDSSESDQSPPRRRKNEEYSGKGKNRGNSDSDQSPPRRRKNDGNVDKEEYGGRGKNRRNSDSDQSPPRRRKNDGYVDKEEYSGRGKNRRNSDSDQSPPRRRKNDGYVDKEEYSGKGKNRGNSDSDQSPPRRRKNDRNVDKEEYSGKGKNRGNSDSDQSPPRRRKNHDRAIDKEESRGKGKTRRNSDSDLSPPRRSKNDVSTKNRNKKSRGSDSDLSPPRAPKNARVDSRSNRDQGRNDDSRRRRDERSPKRSRSRWTDDDSRNSKNIESHGKNSSSSVQPKMKKTLDGKTAGLQDARALRVETEAHKKREAAMFKGMSAEVSGVGQAAVFRDRKTGRRRDLAAEAAHTREKEKRQAEIDEKYAKWGKGLKQVDDQAEKRERDMYEMSKPLARYANDPDLDKALREVEREGDTMLDEIRKRRVKEGKSEPARAVYQGSYAPNRFGIRPGHRWDGVDRSNGYEKKWFEARNARTALQEEAYKWSTADM